MTELEALAKDCIENHTHRLVDKPTKQDIYRREESIFIQGYRQSEKRIEELKNVCDATQELLDNQIETTNKLFKENAELKEQFSDVLECFASASSGDDFEMAESAREVMEILNIPCYRHGKVKSKLTEAKELLKQCMKYYFHPEVTEYPYDKVELFLKEVSE